MKTKRILSAVMSAVMVFTMFAVLTLVTTVAVPLTASAATTTTEGAIFIGSTTKTVTCAFIPLNITVSSTTWYKLSFKCKMLQNGRSTAQAGKPSIGILGQAASDYSTAYAIGTCPSWAGSYASESSDTDDYNNNATITDGVYSMYFKLDSGTWNKSVDKYSQGNRSFYLTIGNAAFRNFSSHVAFDNMGCSFIFSNVSLYQAASNGGATSGSNLIPQINDSNVDFGGTYFYLSDAGSSSTYADAPLGASANKWHVMSMPNHVKYITVPSNYNTSSNYNSANFSQTAATDYTREYYTNSNYSDLTFAKLANSNNAGFQVIPADVNKKMIVIDANHEGEADDRTTDGYQPVYNRPANIFIPLSLGQYNINKYGATTDTSYLVRVSMKAVRLEGDGYPVLGRITPRDTDHSQALGKMAKNLHLSGYYGAGSHEQYTGGEYSYNESTGEFVGWVRMKGGDTSYKTKYGTADILTIGNAEHVWAEGKFDTTEFNSSFAISNIKIDLYSYTGSYTVGSLLYEDIALPLYADTIDTDTRWAYQCSGSNSYSSHARDVARAGQTTWNAEGCVGMVHTVDLTACMKGNHVGNMTHHAATDTTREYWGCSTCRKSYADPYGLEEITDTSASKQMAILQASGSGTETIVYPLKLNTFEGNQWFKFTCKVKCFGDSTPVVSTLYANYDGLNQCETTVTSSNDGDFAVWETSYNASTGILTAYIKAWIKDSINKGSRYPFERINPVSGANCAIVVGNGRYYGSGFAEDNHTTGFAITEPALYKISGAKTGGSSGLADAKTKSTTGGNFVKPITSATVDFTSSYSTSWAASDNPLSAPVGKWYKIGSKKGWIKASNIPTGFYEGTATPKMIELRGLADNSNARYFFQKQLFLDSSKSYTLEFDYRAFGGYDPYVSINYHTGSSWTTLTRTSESFTGSHATITFTTPEGLRTSGDGNFLMRLGLPYESKASSSAYFTNIKVTSASGNNSLIYGDFSLSDAGTLTAGNTDTVMYGWENTANLAAGYSSVKVMSIPSGLFTGTTLSGDTTIALKVQGQNYIEPQFKVRLKAGTYYKFSYDYRSIDDAPEFFVRDDDVDTPTLISSYSGGKYRMTYQVYNAGAEDYSRFCFSFGANSSSKTMYIGNLQLYELTGAGGSTVGANIIGNMNAILDSSVYSGITSSGTAVTLTQDDATNITRNLANGWFVAIPSSVYTDDAKVVKVASDFFNYKTPAQRQELIRKVVLGRASANSADPTYDPNNDGTLGDVKDLVHSKIATVYAAGDTQNVTDSMVEAMFETTIMNPNDSSAYGSGGTKYYVSYSSGNDSNAGTSESAPLKTFAKANSKASAGDTVYLKRGDTWYTPDATADASFTLKSGVHYAAYGSGAKPLLSGSLKNYGGSSNSSGWTETSSGSHIWQYTYYSGSATTNANAGMIYFIDADGTVHPGKDIAAPDTANNVYTYNSADLDSDLEYFAPYKSGSNTITASPYSTFGKIYVYSTTNPATRFPNIQIALTHHIVEANNGTGSSESAVTSMTNIAVMFGASHGVKSVSGGQNFWINKCEIAYIGGAPQFISAGSNRLGNGVEFGNGYTNGRVYDSYIHDCFDAGLTFQSYKSGLNSAVSFNNIYFCRNVIENCTYNIEFFLNRNDSDTMSNIYIEDNILRNAGYGWGCYDRADGGFRIGNIAASKNSYINNVSSTYIRNNILDCTRMAHVMWTWSTSPDRHAGLTATGNTFIQRKGASSWSVMAYGPIGGGFTYASDKTSLNNAAGLFDTAPNSIVWLGDLG